MEGAVDCNNKEKEDATRYTDRILRSHVTEGDMARNYVQRVTPYNIVCKQVIIMVHVRG